MIDDWVEARVGDGDIITSFEATIFLSWYGTIPRNGKDGMELARSDVALRPVEEECSTIMPMRRKTHYGAMSP